MGPAARQQLEETLLQGFFTGPWRVAWEERRAQEGRLTPTAPPVSVCLAASPTNHKSSTLAEMGIGNKWGMCGRAGQLGLGCLLGLIGMESQLGPGLVVLYKETYGRQE